MDRLMPSIRTILNYLAVFFPLILMASCGYFQNVPPPAPPAPPPVKKHISISIQNPQKGIESYRVECAKHPNNQELIKEYIKALEDLKTSADIASETGDFTSAGRLYKVLFKNYKNFRPLAKMLSFDRAYVYARLSYCKSNLSRKGFEEYRKGNLKEAIGYWRGYLAIDPYNEDIRKALGTASLQQKNLDQAN
jgi:tetratricopeptide (TPR) repeat protein